MNCKILKLIFSFHHSQILIFKHLILNDY